MEPAAALPELVHEEFVVAPVARKPPKSQTRAAGPSLRICTIPADAYANEPIVQVLTRAAEDRAFITELTYRGVKALEPYELETEAKAALLSGDVQWIEARVGKLDPRLRTWLDCRLQQEIW